MGGRNERLFWILEKTFARACERSCGKAHRSERNTTTACLNRGEGTQTSLGGRNNRLSFSRNGQPPKTKGFKLRFIVLRSLLFALRGDASSLAESYFLLCAITVYFVPPWSRAVVSSVFPFVLL